MLLRFSFIALQRLSPRFRAGIFYLRLIFRLQKLPAALKSNRKDKLKIIFASIPLKADKSQNAQNRIKKLKRRPCLWKPESLSSALS
jgi:hypothetical protein